MSDKKRTQRHSRPIAIEVPGTPEQVWHAIATGPGITSWLFQAEVEERKGGAVVFHMGPGLDSNGHVTSWEPPKKFAYEEPNWMEGAPPLGTEFVIEAQSGGTCVVRLVHSLFASADEWNDELDGFEAGWRGFFKVLRLYLTHFAGRRALGMGVQVDSGLSQKTEAWNTFRSALGLAGLRRGDAWASHGSGAPAFTGTLEDMGEGKEHEALLLLAEPAQGMVLFGVGAWAGKVHVAASFYLFGDHARDAASSEAAWAQWLTRVFSAEKPR
jgi:uncharacterized protein YndB with AHSA1/START domain